jgi:hypothetical protein
MKSLHGMGLKKGERGNEDGGGKSVSVATCLSALEAINTEQIPIKFDVTDNMMAAFSSIESKLYQLSAESEEAITYSK